MPNGKRARRARREERGFDKAFAVETVTNSKAYLASFAVSPSVGCDLSWSTFEEFIEDFTDRGLLAPLPEIRVDVFLCYDKFKFALPTGGLGVPDHRRGHCAKSTMSCSGVMYAFAKNYDSGSKGGFTGGPTLATSLANFRKWTTAYHRRTGRKISKTDTIRVRNFIKTELKDKYKLKNTMLQRAIPDRSGIEAWVKAIFSPDFRLAQSSDCMRLLAWHLLMITSCERAGSSLIQTKGAEGRSDDDEDLLKQLVAPADDLDRSRESINGALEDGEYFSCVQWRNCTFYVDKPAEGKIRNRLRCRVDLIHGKTVDSSDRETFFGDRDAGSTDGALVLAILADHDVVLPSSLPTLLDPERTIAGDAGLMIVLKGDDAFLAIFRSDSTGRQTAYPWTVKHANNLLAQTSKVAGFARAVTTHNFRHMMARTLKRDGLSLNEIQMALGHRWFGQVTKLYWGNHSMADDTAHLFGGEHLKGADMFAVSSLTPGFEAIVRWLFPWNSDEHSSRTRRCRSS